MGSILNCTPHNVVVYNEAGEEVTTYPPSDYSARLVQEPQQQVGALKTETGKSVPVYSPQKFGDVEGLPPCEDGNYPDIIVSMLVGQRLQENGVWKGGVYGPDTGIGAVREGGQIKGTTRLIQYCARKTFDSQS